MMWCCDLCYRATMDFRITHFEVFQWMPSNN
ncbi:hypothetical protein BIW11_09494 [Tropilaelaps mercedesae]|uniref:Uncharacterized protein n=1 Tax=Tropilaelaps mercedesae TaxID=418985 RepID=A0A1V9XK61_9ACAR|nr:hypothetical protein BIW11_09494 [Tropilaelaps mercedesae]